MSGFNLWIVLTAVSSYLVGYLNSLYSCLFYSIRVNSAAAHKLYHHLKEKRAWKFTSAESFEWNKKDLPTQESAVYWFKVPFAFNVVEKFLTAGQTGSEKQVYIYTLRIFRKIIISLLEEVTKVEDKRDYIDINLNIDYTGYRCTNRVKKVSVIGRTILATDADKQIRSVFDDIETGRRIKSGIVLAGPPGEGKTSIVKEMAALYDYDIYVPLFQPSHVNKEIVALFDNIPKDSKTIVLLEDFDSIFHGRQNQLKDANFTLDVILNVLDGAYIDMSKKVVILTCNDINKIDSALRRPSRFDYTIFFPAPPYDVRLKILQLGGLNGLADKVAEITEGCSGAMLREISTRHLSHETYEEEVKNIISSFGRPNKLTQVLKNDPNVIKFGELVYVDEGTKEPVGSGS